MSGSLVTTTAYGLQVNAASAVVSDGGNGDAGSGAKGRVTVGMGSLVALVGLGVSVVVGL